MPATPTDPSREATRRGSRADAVARPEVLIFDVNETLSDMAPLAGRFADVGAPAHLAQQWFAELLRDGFALTAAGGIESFATLGAEALKVRLDPQPLDRPVDDAVDHIMQGFSQLTVHPDVVDGVRALSGLGIRLVTLSNGSASVADSLLRGAGVRAEFEQLLTVEDAAAWKPSPRSYAYALERCGVAPPEAMLVAVHPWDIDGAHRAHLRTAWVDRKGTYYPGYFATPEVTAASLTELADALT